jgi:hypothetical protein
MERRLIVLTAVFLLNAIQFCKMSGLAHIILEVALTYVKWCIVSGSLTRQVAQCVNLFGGMSTMPRLDSAHSAALRDSCLMVCWHGVASSCLERHNG